MGDADTTDSPGGESVSVYLALQTSGHRALPGPYIIKIGMPFGNFMRDENIWKRSDLIVFDL